MTSTESTTATPAAGKLSKAARSEPLLSTNSGSVQTGTTKVIDRPKAVCADQITSTGQSGPDSKSSAAKVRLEEANTRGGKTSEASKVKESTSTAVKGSSSGRNVHKSVSSKSAPGAAMTKKTASATKVNE